MKLMLGKNKSLKTSYKTPCYEVFIFAVLFLEFICNIPDISRLNFWNSIYYVLSYDAFGFNSRLILGSIIHIFTDYISTKTVYIFINVSTVLFIVFITAVVGKVARTISKNTDIDAEIFIVLFCACPVSILYLFNVENFGRLDLYLIFISVLILLCVKNNKAKWSIPFLCFLAMAVNQNFAVMYMPVLGIVLLNEFFFSKNSKIALFIFIVSCLTVIVSFIYFKFLAPTPGFESLAEIKAFLSGRTNIKNGEIVVGYEYYINYFDYYTKEFGYKWVKDVISTYGISMLIATAPLLLAFIAFWVDALKSAKKATKKIIFLFCFLAPIGGLPMFIAVDWDRWIPTLFISQFMLVFYFLAANDNDAVESGKNLKSFFTKHYLLFLVLIMYSASFIFSNFLFFLINSLKNNVDFYHIVNNYFSK